MAFVPVNQPPIPHNGEAHIHNDQSIESTSKLQSYSADTDIEDEDESEDEYGSDYEDGADRPNEQGILNTPTRRELPNDFEPRRSLHPATRCEKTTAELYDLINTGDLDLNPECQRHVVWTVSAKTDLIDSLIGGYFVPSLLFNAEEKTEKGMTKIIRNGVDGKQRLTSIKEFMDGHLPCKDRWGKKWYYCHPVDAKGVQQRRPRCKILPEVWKQKFRRITIPCSEYWDLSMGQQRDLFARVQKGIALTGAETLFATDGLVQTFVKSIVSRHTSVVKLCKNKRCSDFLYVAAVTAQIHEVQKHLHNKAISTSSRDPAHRGSKRDVENFLNLNQQLSPELDKVLRAVQVVYSVYDRVSTDSPEIFTVQAILKPETTAETFSPMEYIAVGVIIWMYGYQSASSARTFNSLADDIRWFRNEWRGKVDEVKNHGKSWKIIWPIIQNLAQRVSSTSMPTPPPSLAEGDHSQDAKNDVAPQQKSGTPSQRPSSCANDEVAPQPILEEVISPTREPSLTSKTSSPSPMASNKSDRGLNSTQSSLNKSKVSKAVGKSVQSSQKAQGDLYPKTPICHSIMSNPPLRIAASKAYEKIHEQQRTHDSESDYDSDSEDDHVHSRVKGHAASHGRRGSLHRRSKGRKQRKKSIAANKARDEVPQASLTVSDVSSSMTTIDLDRTNDGPKSAEKETVAPSALKIDTTVDKTTQIKSENPTQWGLSSSLPFDDTSEPSSATRSSATRIPDQEPNITRLSQAAHSLIQNQSSETPPVMSRNKEISCAKDDQLALPLPNQVHEAHNNQSLRQKSLDKSQPSPPLSSSSQNFSPTSLVDQAPSTIPQTSTQQAPGTGVNQTPKVTNDKQCAPIESEELQNNTVSENFRPSSGKTSTTSSALVLPRSKRLTISGRANPSLGPQSAATQASKDAPSTPSLIVKLSTGKPDRKAVKKKLGASPMPSVLEGPHVKQPAHRPSQYNAVFSKNSSVSAISASTAPSRAPKLLITPSQTSSMQAPAPRRVITESTSSGTHPTPLIQESTSAKSSSTKIEKRRRSIFDLNDDGNVDKNRPLVSTGRKHQRICVDLTSLN